MIRNIPNKYTIKDLSDEIDYYFNNTYDFLYLPCDLNVSFLFSKESMQCGVRVYQFSGYSVFEGVLFGFP